MVSSESKLQDPRSDSNDSPDSDYYDDYMATAIPIDCAIAVTAAAAGIVLDDDIPPSSLKTSEPRTPESLSASEASDISQLREVDKYDRKNSIPFDDCASESSDNRFDNSDRAYLSTESGQASPDTGSTSISRSRTLERLASSESLFRWEICNFLQCRLILAWTRINI